MASQFTAHEDTRERFSSTKSHPYMQPEVSRLESPDFFRQFFTAAPFGLCLLSPQGRLLTLNQQFADLLGAPVARLLDQSLEQLLAGKSPRCHEWLACALRGEPVEPLEVECTIAHGTRLLSLQPFTAPQRHTGVALLARDITAERQQQQERDFLYQLAHDLARSLDIGPIADTVLSWAQKLLGVDYVDLMVADPGSPELHGVANTVDSNAFRQERIDTSKELAIASHIFRRRQAVVIDNFTESPLVSKRLRERYPLRSIWGVPMMSGETVVGVLCAAYLTPHEITPDKVRLLQLLGDEAALAVERARLTESLQARTTELQRSNAELEEFAYAASHDLQEPLRGIRHYAERLREEHASSLVGAEMEHLATINRLSQRLETLIDTLLHYARMGRSELTLTTADLNQLVSHVRELLTVRFSETGVELRIPRPLPSLPCVPVLVTEVLSNLMSNALKYNTKEQKWVEVGWVAPGEQVPAHIQDPANAHHLGSPIFVRA